LERFIVFYVFFLVANGQRSTDLKRVKNVMLLIYVFTSLVLLKYGYIFELGYDVVCILIIYSCSYFNDNKYALCHNLNV
jgi:hypothetical protein